MPAANRQPALAVCASSQTPFAVNVSTVDATRISAITGIVSLQVFASFDLSRPVP